jgi:hypothetical protein
MYGDAAANGRGDQEGGTQRSATATFDAYGIEPAKTPRGRADQWTQLLADARGGYSGPELAARYGPLIEDEVAKLRRRGRKPKKSAAIKAWLARNNIPPRAQLTSKQRKRIVADTDSSMRTVNTVLNEGDW